MADKPTVLPKWADQNEQDPISGQNNVLEPPNEKKEFGWNRLEFPPRNWFNWLGRYTFRWLDWLKQQEEQAIITNGEGLGLFPTDDALITYYAIDKETPANYLVAIGFKESSVDPVLNVTSSNVLTLDTANFTPVGDAPITQATITGSDYNNVIIWGQTKIIP